MSFINLKIIQRSFGGIRAVFVFKTLSFLYPGYCIMGSMPNKNLKTKKSKRKRFVKTIIIFFIFASFFGLTVINIGLRPKIFFHSAGLEVDFLDVGQGDAALIKTPGGKIILIDGGPDNRVLWRLGKNLPFYRRQIDLMIFSHYHEDHITGLIEILRRYRVKKIIYAATDSEITATAGVFLQEAKTRGIPLVIINHQAVLELDEKCFLKLLNPGALGVKSDPNNSLIVKLDCAGDRFLFTGDSSATVEKALLSSDFDLTADIFKASHHGSNSANSEAFLLTANPAALVISVGAGNKFGHPDQRILERAAASGINVKRTDQDGDIKIISP